MQAEGGAFVSSFSCPSLQCYNYRFLLCNNHFGTFLQKWITDKSKNLCQNQNKICSILPSIVRCVKVHFVVHLICFVATMPAEAFSFVKRHLAICWTQWMGRVAHNVLKSITKDQFWFHLYVHTFVINILWNNSDLLLIALV